MRADTLPKSRDLVLIGGGHTHALVLRRWGMSPLAGVRLTLIDPGPMTAYTGMLPGFVAGHYDREALDIDLVRLARHAGARLIQGGVDLIDPQAQRIRVPGRPLIGYDVTSVDIGITSTMPEVPGFATHAVPAKPMAVFASAWERFRAQIRTDRPAEVAIIGGGFAGVELALAMAYALRGLRARISLIERTRVLADAHPAAARALRARLARADVALIENSAVVEVSSHGVHLSDGQVVAAQFVTGAAGARPAGWLAHSGLDLHNGYVAVDQHLRSSDPSIFAAGDCAHMLHTPRPKAGVFAVRQAPILDANLRATLRGQGELRRYRPQRDYLKLVSLGAKSALAEKGGFALSGPLLWRWKNRIDQRFMAQFRELPEMAQPALPRHYAQGLPEALGPKPLCGGCGAKVGPLALRRALDPAGHGLPGDDAAVLETGGVRQVISTDHLRAMIEDPVAMTRIAAVHALGDMWAMGAQPQAATAMIILPRLSADLAERTLAEMLEAARAVLGTAGAALVGGHTTQGAELTVGFTVTGLCEDAPITLDGGRAGDVLILTKPIGTGVIMAAEMAGKARGPWVAHALDQMQRPQAQAARRLRDAHAMTDVTGFGLAGHLANMCEASGTGVQLTLDAVPLLPGALELAQAGQASSLLPENRAALPHLPKGPLVDLLFDPQTAGGLLAAVPAETATQVLADLGPQAARIGVLTGDVGQIEIV